MVSESSFVTVILSVLAILVGVSAQAFDLFGTSAQKQPLEKPRLTERGLIKVKGAPDTLPKSTEVASFAAGCFWGVEQEFRKQKGVLATAVGFMGGKTKAPTYHEVSEGDTGHAETVQVEFDSNVVSYDELLDLFWHLHDPTTLNRQGPDHGSQYRSAVFYHSAAQKQRAQATRDELARSGELSSPIVTEIVPAGAFTKAEEYHQQYVEKGGRAGCHLRRKKS